MTSKRVNSILTDVQREFLKNDEDDGSSRARMTRSRIRERIRAAFFDFSLLLSEFEHDELVQTLDIMEHTDDHTEGLSAGIIDGTAFMLASEVAAYPSKSIGNPNSYGPLLNESIQRACRHAGVAVDVSIDLDIETLGPLDDVVGGDLSELSLSTLRQLHFSGRLSGEEFDEEVRSRIESETT